MRASLRLPVFPTPETDPKHPYLRHGVTLKVPHRFRMQKREALYTFGVGGMDQCTTNRTSGLSMRSRTRCLYY